MADGRARRIRKATDDPGLCSWCSARARWTCKKCGQRVCQGHKVNPWDTSHTTELYSEPYAQCLDNSHPHRKVEYLEPLTIEVCLDPLCAKVIAHCNHQITEPETAERAEHLKSICKWNEDGTVLTCTFCGVDGT